MKKYLPYVVIVLFVLINYHLLLGNAAYTFKWDMAEQYLSWRYFLGLCLQNGTLPLWDPYQLGGYPFYADPQSSAWYLPAWITGYFFGYSMKVIQHEFVLSILFGAIGFYEFSKTTGRSVYASLVVAVSYAACGFFIGNAQHMTWIVAGAWLPWVLNYYFRFQEHFSVRYIYPLVFFVYLFVSGSYPAFSIVLAYFILVHFAVRVFRMRNKEERRAGLLRFSLLALLVLLVCSFMIISVLSSHEYFSRGAGITLEKANTHSFSPYALSSLLLPFTSFKSVELFRADQSMTNAYIGIVGFAFLLIGLLKKQDRSERVLWIVSVLLLLISFGEFASFRSFLYHYVPGFNLFRFPALFRLFFIITFLLLVAKNIDDYLLHGKTLSIYQRSVFILLLISLLVAGYVYLPPDLQFLNALGSVELLSELIEHSVLSQHIFVQALIQLIVLLMLTGIYLVWKGKRRLVLITALVCMDMFLASYLNFPATVVYASKTSATDELIKDAPQKFIVPPFERMIDSKDENYLYRWPLNWNMSNYFQKIAHDGYNPFVLNTYDQFTEDPLRDSVWQNEWLYVEGYNAEKSQSVFSVTDFKPGRVIIHTHADSALKFVLMQNNYPGWYVDIDGQASAIMVKNSPYMATLVPAGQHVLRFSFRPWPVYAGMLLSGGTLVFLFLMMLRRRDLA